MPDMITLKIGNKIYDIRDIRIGDLADLDTTAKNSLVSAINEVFAGRAPTDQQVQEAVDAWLEAHPEATTTVEDGSITKAKLVAALSSEITQNTEDVADLKSATDNQTTAIDATDIVPVDYLFQNVGLLKANGSGIRDYADGRYTDYIRVKQGDKIDYALFSTGAAYGLILFYNTAMAYQSTLVSASAGGTLYSGSVTISEDGYIRACTRFYSLERDTTQLFINDQKFRTVFDVYNDDVLSKTGSTIPSVNQLCYNVGLRYASNDNINSYADGRFSDLIPVYKGETIEYGLFSTGANYSLIQFYNTSKSFVRSIAAGDSGGALFTGVVTVPDDGYVRVCTRYCSLSAGTSYARFSSPKILNDWMQAQLAERKNSNAKELYTAFRKVGVIGDSYSAVRLYKDVGGTITSVGDVPFYSWAKFMERKSGMSYSVFAKGGLEASQWLTDADAGYPVASQSANLCQAYIVALGINDCGRHDLDYIGTTADIDTSNPDNNANTFVGNYAKIIQKMKALVDGAKFFVVTMPSFTSDTGKARYTAYNDAIRQIASFFQNVYLVDLYADYWDLYNEPNGFFANNIINGHYTVPAYERVAEIMTSEISKIMMENPTEFEQIEFIGDGWLS